MNEPILIKRMKSRGGFYELTFSHQEETVRVPLLMAGRHRLDEGRSMSPPEFESLVAEVTLELCNAEAVRLLALREHTRGELTRKLKRKEFASTTIAAACANLEERGLLDDRRYADTLARRTLERKPCGRGFLLAALQRKLVPRPLAEEAVNFILEANDDNEIALKALRPRWSRLSQFDVETARRKAYTYLSRRGIGYQAAKAAFEHLQEETNEEQDD